MGPGTFMAPSSPCVSPSIPSVKKRVSGLPFMPNPVPKPRDQRPPFVLPTPTLIGDRAHEIPVRVEDVDVIGHHAKAEIADQQVVRERTEAGRGESKAPRRGEWAADGGHPQEVSILIENRHSPHAGSGRCLGWTSRGPVGPIHLPVEVLDLDPGESR